MCGIAALALARGARMPAAWPELVSVVLLRGPDAHETRSFQLAEGTSVQLTASVLCLRGPCITPQPLATDALPGVVLIWNGQVWDTRDEALARALAAGENDGVHLLERIAHRRRATVADALVSTLAEIEGPYAFVLLDYAQSRVYYGRDPLGRRSLLCGREAGSFFLASHCAAGMEAWAPEEVACSAVWCADLRDRSVRCIERHAPRLVLCDVPPAAARAEPDQHMALAQFQRTLEQSVQARVTRIRSDAPDADTRVAVLFSGGLDCTVLAAMAHRHIPERQGIDLINVAFENPRALAHAEPGTPTYAVPDRRTALASLRELQAYAPGRHWRLIEVDVPYAEYLAHLDTIRALLQPSDSVMDLSIGAALYFAARGQGRGATTPARVLLSGLGADELLAGYARHRQAFRRGGAPALAQELQQDLDRLPSRNLGRDDRVVGVHGKEVRYPYLARDVITYLCTLPVSAKAGLDGEQFEDKRLLRRLALQLGLEQVALQPKRAIQFGARSAKMDAAAARRKGAEPLE